MVADTCRSSSVKIIIIYLLCLSLPGYLHSWIYSLNIKTSEYSTEYFLEVVYGGYGGVKVYVHLACTAYSIKVSQTTKKVKLQNIEGVCI